MAVAVRYMGQGRSYGSRTRHGAESAPHRDPRELGPFAFTAMVVGVTDVATAVSDGTYIAGVAIIGALSRAPTFNVATGRSNRMDQMCTKASNLEQMCIRWNEECSCESVMFFCTRLSERLNWEEEDAADRAGTNDKER
ncbi:hypothetical protein FISHEDRAFT_60000 [Fistulina hepatica ATCC 64428]|uniref:Uncharacterized protein n=1 Tax=Fistulina hepatica ATCC 64428 TaxID=1128425 RepID=A0A0D7A866_9AGAR|nr:hypothetical protein FISHEDRAFT_60000 [Fistulina hepatica ATCC 64428]